MFFQWLVKMFIKISFCSCRHHFFFITDIETKQVVKLAFVVEECFRDESQVKFKHIRMEKSSFNFQLSFCIIQTNYLLSSSVRRVFKIECRNFFHFLWNDTWNYRMENYSLRKFDEKEFYWKWVGLDSLSNNVLIYFTLYQRLSWLHIIEFSFQTWE